MKKKSKQTAHRTPSSRSFGFTLSATASVLVSSSFFVLAPSSSMRSSPSSPLISSSYSMASSSDTVGPLSRLRLASLPESCHSISFLNAPSLFWLSSLNVPVSATLPSFPMHMIVSERWIVDRRWAIDIVVLLPSSKEDKAWLTSVSDSASRALVASSRIRMSGFLRSARAIARRCFCPPESCVPLAPTWVSSPSG